MLSLSLKVEATSGEKSERAHLKHIYNSLGYEHIKRINKDFFVLLRN